jgi:hypothetical protein
LKQLFLWIQGNPQAFKAFLMSFLAMLVKLILQVSGKSAELAHWNDAVSQTVDLITYAISAYGVIAGGVHVSRGPALTDSTQASVIVSAIQGPPVANAVAEVATAVQEIAQPSVPPPLPPHGRSF